MSIIRSAILASNSAHRMLTGNNYKVDLAPDFALRTQDNGNQTEADVAGQT